MSAGQVAALYVRGDSVYKSLGVDCWDIDRDARRYGGPGPVVAHPPCRAWGRLRSFAKPRRDEKALALRAVWQVRRFGGVLEHPASSLLFMAAGGLRPGQRMDMFGGWVMPVNQQDFGHLAPKATWLYVVGLSPAKLPGYGLRLGVAPGRIANMSKANRERTPEAFARWLVDIAARCGK